MKDLGHPEVQHLGVPLFGDENIGGLDAAVNDTRGVGGVKSVLCPFIKGITK